jgi:hypothetical protein
MKKELRAAFAAVVLAATCSAVATNAKSNEGPSFLQGSWKSSIAVLNCVSGDALTPVSDGLTTFHQGGTLSESRGAAPGTARGPGHGVWYRTAERTFKVKVVFQRFDLNGFLIGTQEIISTNTVSKDSRSATIAATFKLLDNSGITLISGCAGGDAQRMLF